MPLAINKNLWKGLKAQGVLWISSDRDDQMGAIIKLQKIPRASNKIKKTLDQNLTPQKTTMQCYALNIKTVTLFTELHARIHGNYHKSSD